MRIELVFGLEHKSPVSIIPGALPLFGSLRVWVVITNPAHIKQILSYKILFLPRAKTAVFKSAAHPSDSSRPCFSIALLSLLSDFFSL